jgi:hypothetical protein
VRLEVTAGGFGRSIRCEIDAHTIPRLSFPLAAHPRRIERARRDARSRASAVADDDAFEIRAFPFTRVGVTRVTLHPDGAVLVEGVRAVPAVFARTCLSGAVAAPAALRRERGQGTRNQYRNLARITGAELEYVETLLAPIFRGGRRDAFGFGLPRGRSFALCRIPTAGEN